MLDWRSLVFNSLWVFAAALALAALSHASWMATLRSVRKISVIRQTGYRMVLNLSGLLFCAGMAGNSQKTWHLGVWGILAVLFLVELGRVIRIAINTP